MGGLNSVRFIRDQISTITALTPQSATGGAVTGAVIDRFSYGNAQSAVLHHAAGAVTGAPTALSVATVLQHSSDGTTFSTFATVTALSASSTDAALGIDLSGADRYLRVQTTVTLTGGTSPALPVAALLVLGGQTEQPAV